MYQVTRKTVANKTLLMVMQEGDRLVAQICLNEGGRIVNWYDDGKQIIGEPLNSNYDTSYAGSILVPFVNRIENGVFSFNNDEYQLATNESGMNAIHGLVYNQYFDLVNLIQEQEFTELYLETHDLGNNKGYPYAFKTKLVYRFAPKTLSIKLGIQNTGVHALPYNLGWHPYFYIDDKQKSDLIFSAKKCYKTNDRGITNGDEVLFSDCRLQLSEDLDDAFLLKNEEVKLIMGKRFVKIKFPKGDNYLQVYTPKNEDYVAVEPMTGISNSFNNNIGLQVLEPNKSATKEWSLNLYEQ